MGAYCSHMDTTTFPKALAEVVKIALTEAGISQRDAASLTGIPLTTLTRRLSGNSPFLSTELDRIASLAGTTVSALAAEAEAAARGAA